MKLLLILLTFSILHSSKKEVNVPNLNRIGITEQSLKTCKEKFVDTRSDKSLQSANNRFLKRKEPVCVNNVALTKKD